MIKCVWKWYGGITGVLMVILSLITPSHTHTHVPTKPYDLVGVDELLKNTITMSWFHASTEETLG